MKVEPGRLGRSRLGLLLGFADPGLECSFGGLGPCRELRLGFLQRRLLFLHHGGAREVGDSHNRGLVASSALHAGVRGLVEVGEEPVVVLL